MAGEFLLRIRKRDGALLTPTVWGQEVSYCNDSAPAGPPPPPLLTHSFKAIID